MDRALQKCYEHDIDWTLLPERLLRVRVLCFLFLYSSIAYSTCMNLKGNCRLLTHHYLKFCRYAHCLEKDWSRFQQLSFLAYCHWFPFPWVMGLSMLLSSGPNQLYFGWLSFCQQVGVCHTAFLVRRTCLKKSIYILSGMRKGAILWWYIIVSAI